ncbi:hypothetical protein [Nocardia callitridis]|uniref:DUF998 domain-containing protein n=1 Tax=Nocardia callitridis TaxID=648753 RepID=A0ABP9KD00_9NOCA
MDTKTVERPLLCVALYVVVSAALGPATYILGFSLFTNGSWDYCGRVQSGPNSEDAAFRYAEIFQITSATALLILGVVVLVALWLPRQHISILRRGIATLGILPMLCGYGFVIHMAGYSGLSC